MSMKAIETAYKGYRFRSRLEARWAVFFDKLGVAWEYEPEGFDLGAAGRYLPDFWLPKEELWIEIKPLWPTAEEKKKAHSLHDWSKKPVMFLIGTPPGVFLLVTEDCTTRSAGTSWWDSRPNTFNDLVFFKGKFGVAISTCDDRMFDGDTIWNLADLFEYDDFTSVAEICHPITAASDAARSARFEFGEAGAPA